MTSLFLNFLFDLQRANVTIRIPESESAFDLPIEFSMEGQVIYSKILDTSDFYEDDGEHVKQFFASILHEVRQAINEHA